VSPTLSTIADLQPQLQLPDFQRSAQLATDIVDGFRMAKAQASTAVESLIQEQQALWNRVRESELRHFMVVSQVAIEELTRTSAQPASSRTFVGDLFQRLGNLTEREDETGLSEGLDEVVEWFSEETKRHPVSLSTLLALLSILITIVVALHSYISAHQSEQRITERIAESSQQTALTTQKLIAESEARMLQTLERHAKAVTTAKLLVVTKRLHLYSGPSSQSESLRVLRPNTQLEETGEDGDWLAVQFFDFEAGQLREGWVYRRFVCEVVVSPEEIRSSAFGNPVNHSTEEPENSGTQEESKPGTDNDEG